MVNDLTLQIPKRINMHPKAKAYRKGEKKHQSRLLEETLHTNIPSDFKKRKG
jgi:hypothetical protein